MGSRHSAGKGTRVPQQAFRSLLLVRIGRVQGCRNDDRRRPLSRKNEKGTSPARLQAGNHPGEGKPSGTLSGQSGKNGRSGDARLYAADPGKAENKITSPAENRSASLSARARLSRRIGTGLSSTSAKARSTTNPRRPRTAGSTSGNATPCMSPSLRSAT